MRDRSNRRRSRTNVKRKAITAGLAAVVVVGGLVIAPQAFGGTLTSRFGSGAAAGRAGSGAGTNAAGCSDVHIIATRASTERPGAGIIGSLVNAVKSASDQSISTDTTDYPASLANYTSSESQGVAALTRLVETQVQQCPQQKLVLMGYSQGAHVTGDVLAGGSGRLGRGSAPIGADAAGNVAAVILMGDPAFVPGKSFNAGTSNRAGVFPRGAAQSLDPFADRIQSYCDTGDNFCASGGSLSVHLGYTRKYNGQAEAFVLEKIGG